MLCSIVYASLFWYPSLRNASFPLAVHPSFLCSPPFVPSPSFISLLAVIPRRLLTRLQLLQIEPTRPHVPTRLIEARRKFRCIRRTGTGLLVLIAVALALAVEVVVHWLRVGILLVGRLLGFFRCGLGRPAAAEEPPDCVSDG
jgi:hypothetical protein